MVMLLRVRLSMDGSDPKRTLELSIESDPIDSDSKYPLFCYTG